MHKLHYLRFLFLSQLWVFVRSWMQHRPTDSILLPASLYCNTVVVTVCISYSVTVIFRNIPLSVLFLLTHVFTGILFRIRVVPICIILLSSWCICAIMHNLSSHAGKMQKRLCCSCFTVQWTWMRECVAHRWWARAMIRKWVQMVSVMVNGNVCCLSQGGGPQVVELRRWTGWRSSSGGCPCLYAVLGLLMTPCLNWQSRWPWTSHPQPETMVRYVNVSSDTVNARIVSRRHFYFCFAIWHVYIASVLYCTNDMIWQHDIKLKRSPWKGSKTALF